ncbi:DUF397 domain-containing protein [Actinomadura decatromicini]|uniref:DUF397 domain-containing protein n=1 Tax=Actinomadura decatromicini TaxID=2604572 RepID=A0A5D3FD27_9ACTN|nr:DUF397 domain-containing protein [Actinomadura decatromicini]TYK46009.1 DUF397 domain-containing protein [Actinomadura decatromicini]
METDKIVWRKANRSTSTGGECVELAALSNGLTAIRDSKNPDGPKLLLERNEFAALVTALKR